MVIEAKGKRKKLDDLLNSHSNIFSSRILSKSIFCVKNHRNLSEWKFICVQAIFKLANWPNVSYLGFAIPVQINAKFKNVTPCLNVLLTMDGYMI